MCVLGDWHDSPVWKDGVKTGKYVACQWKCGVCPDCLNEKRKDFIVRSYCEMLKVHKISPKFFTLTYNQPEYIHSLCTKGFTRDWQLFLKRLRKYTGNKNIRYVRTVELGSVRQRLHFHVIFFNLPFIPQNKIEELWRKGFVKPKELKGIDGIKYVCKYISKPSVSAEWKKTFGIKRKVVCSKGLGVNPNHSVAYLMQLLENPFILIGGYKYYIGRYMRRKLIEESKYDEIRNKYDSQKIDYLRGARKKFGEKYSERSWYRRDYSFSTFDALRALHAAVNFGNALEIEYPRQATIDQINSRLWRSEDPHLNNLKIVRKYKEKAEKETGEINYYPVGYEYILKHSAAEA